MEGTNEIKVSQMKDKCFAFTALIDNVFKFVFFGFANSVNSMLLKLKARKILNYVKKNLRKIFIGI